MKDYKTEINNGEELAHKLTDLGYEPECVEGNLQDNYFFEGMENIGFSRGAKPRKYVMIIEHYLNCWSSDHMLILTDNQQTYEKLLSEYQEDYDRAVNA